ncbi:MAG: type IV secretion protein IcmJ [Gammaproteobacteria bacterium RIFCSPHIGHO2_12_FULL_42_10]|nr:MAG: type IV secretion protein IcmJ [Gammaproteobacteria bacterium RIFCSPHIGHO2_12_FULL_42_10]
MHDLRLAVNLLGWRSFVRRKGDKTFQTVSGQIFARDGYACQYCGFQAKEFQEIVNIDGNYTNNKPSNMITACCFCAQCLFLQAVGIDEVSGGTLIYLPEMSQNDLNSFCHVLFCAMGNNTGYQDTSQSVYRSFKFRSQIVENKFGTGTSNPAVMGQVVVEHQARAGEKQKINFLKDLRLLPAHTKFKAQLTAWTESALRELEVDEARA